MATSFSYPPHAYIPGQTQRHPEDLFDNIKATVTPGMSEEVLLASEAFQTGHRYLQAGYYWEAHEVWEAVWMACAPNSATRLFVQGVIQLANAALKAKMGQAKAARSLCQIARTHLTEAYERQTPAARLYSLAVWLELIDRLEHQQKPS